MQGIGLQLRPAQAGKPAFREALMEVLSNPQYAKAAKAMSVKIRARKNTPVQEAAGAKFTPCKSALAALIAHCRRFDIHCEHAMKRCLRCADWIEHVIATGGEPYLRTPENEMSLIVRNSLDVYTVIAAMCCLALGFAHAVLGIILRRCKVLLHACVRSSNGTRDGCVPGSGKVARPTTA